MTQCSLEQRGGRKQKQNWGRKDEEYVADFYLVSRRTLSDAEFRIFKYHYLLGADWILCCRQLKMDRGTFFHYVYRIQNKLGRVFRELEPYGLFPLDEYFGGVNGREEHGVPPSPPVGAVVIPIRPPLRTALQDLLKAA